MFEFRPAPACLLQPASTVKTRSRSCADAVDTCHAFDLARTAAGNGVAPELRLIGLQLSEEEEVVA